MPVGRDFTVYPPRREPTDALRSSLRPLFTNRTNSPWRALTASPFIRRFLRPISDICPLSSVLCPLSFSPLSLNKPDRHRVAKELPVARLNSGDDYEHGVQNPEHGQ